jgi:hypothetical protein
VSVVEMLQAGSGHEDKAEAEAGRGGQAERQVS